MNEFVESIRRGYERVAPLAGGRGELPEAAAIEPWDGGDGQVGVGGERCGWWWWGGVR